MMKKVVALVFAFIALLALAGCNKNKVDEYPISWVYVTGLPEGFPQLSEKLTTTNENYMSDRTEIELVWSRVSEQDFTAYKALIEEWADAKFSDQDDNGAATLTSTVNGKEIKVKAVYNSEATGNHLQGAIYDCQGRIVVIF